MFEEYEKPKKQGFGEMMVRHAQGQIRYLAKCLDWQSQMRHEHLGGKIKPVRQSVLRKHFKRKWSIR